MVEHQKKEPCQKKLKTVGHKKEKLFLEKLHKTSRLGGALAFLGKEGIGKKLLALEFSKGLLCQKGEVFGCDECSVCSKINKFIDQLSLSSDREELPKEFFYFVETEEGKSVNPSPLGEGAIVKKNFAFLIGGHPDLIMVVPDGSQIKIDQIRHLQEYLSLKPLSKHRVVIIDEAHLMNVAAQNALLKTLEEPPPDTLFILVAKNEGQLLPTILSRCRVLQFKPLTKEEIDEILLRLKLQDIPQSVKEILYTEGSLAFLNLLKDNKIEKFLEKVNDYPNLSVEEIINLSEEFEKLDKPLKELLLTLLDKLLLNKTLKGKLPLENYERVSSLVAETLKGIKRGIKAKLAMENIFFLLKE